jgi:hypothetical protein
MTLIPWSELQIRFLALQRRIYAPGFVFQRSLSPFQRLQGHSRPRDRERHAPNDLRHAGKARRTYA